MWSVYQCAFEIEFVHVYVICYVFISRWEDSIIYCLFSCSLRQLSCTFCVSNCFFFIAIFDGILSNDVKKRWCSAFDRWYDIETHSTRYRFAFLLETKTKLDEMDLIRLLPFFVVVLFGEYSYTYATDLMCLKCDSQHGDSGCGEFTQTIPLEKCETYCYFLVLRHRSTPNHLRAIRDCSPFDDVNIDINKILRTKLDDSATLSSLQIIGSRRCDADQCNTDFYTNARELLSNRTNSPRKNLFYKIFLFTLTLLFLV